MINQHKIRIIVVSLSLFSVKLSNYYFNNNLVNQTTTEEIESLVAYDF